MLSPKSFASGKRKQGLWLVLGALLLLTGCDSDSGQSALGKQLYEANCKVCHAQGLNGAPILGNRKMWGKRLTQGPDLLIQHAIEGYGLMPAKGGKTSLSDEQVAEIVRYMVSKAQ